MRGASSTIRIQDWHHESRRKVAPSHIRLGLPLGESHSWSVRDHAQVRLRRKQGESEKVKDCILRSSGR